MCGRKAESEKMLSEIINGMNEVSNLFEGRSVAYIIWNNPYMVAASGTFIDSVMKECGLVNAFKDRMRYPEVQINELEQADDCFLSSEPFPFEQKHVNALQAQLKSCKVSMVNGEMFSWYGSRLRLLPQYLKKLKNELL